MKIKTLEDVTHEELLACFNEAFSDYIIKMHLNLDQLKSKLATEDIDLKSSIGAFRNDKLIGFVLHGVRAHQSKKQAYNGGTGVIPTERGQSLTVKMYKYILPQLKSDGFSKVTLEVISNNDPAIKAYQRIGFSATRTLNCYKGEINLKKTNSDVTIKRIYNYYLESLKLKGEVQPSWQNSAQSIINLRETAHCIGAYKSTVLVGYAVINTSNNRIIQIAVDKERRNARIGSTIMSYIKHKYSATSSIINIDVSDAAINSFFEESGLRNFLQQIEMELRIE